MPFHVGRRTQHMKLLHLISELITIGVNDKLFIELKRHNARIKRLTNRIRTPTGPISQMSIKARFRRLELVVVQVAGGFYLKRDEQRKRYQ